MGDAAVSVQVQLLAALDDPHLPQLFRQPDASTHRAIIQINPRLL